ncbi:hypothetical protein [Aquibacillus saliphilus]|nr:hypothetical protein [Aquibacillus saliphilus]
MTQIELVILLNTVALIISSVTSIMQSQTVFKVVKNDEWKS